MRKRKELPDWRWPSWRYGPGGQSAIFQTQEDVPDGWTKKPGEAEEEIIARSPVYYDRLALVAELTQRGISIDPRWGVAHMKKVLDS